MFLKERQQRLSSTTARDKVAGQREDKEVVKSEEECAVDPGGCLHVWLER